MVAACRIRGHSPSDNPARSDHEGCGSLSAYSIACAGADRIGAHHRSAARTTCSNAHALTRYAPATAMMFSHCDARDIAGSQVSD